ncbi:unnamed protein product [Linum trigynum]|uniref:Uncharacterized protein n=1 Tax=Linum trigynum TaxID=586398 RepID=A0AAV2CQN4_9ROSI
MGAGKEKSKDAKQGHQPKMKEVQTKLIKSPDKKHPLPPENVAYLTRKISFDAKQAKEKMKPENVNQALSTTANCSGELEETAMAVDLS